MPYNNCGTEYANPNGQITYGYSTQTSSTVRYYISHGAELVSSGSTANGRNKVALASATGIGDFWIPSIRYATTKPAMARDTMDAAFGLRNLQQSSNCIGRYVQNLQLVMGTSTDGVFGPKTEAAVKNFQNAYNLSADGVVGSGTKAKLWQVYSDKITQSGF